MDDPTQSDAAAHPAARSNPFEESLTHLVGRIKSGEFAFGSKLPPERDLSEQMAISRTTLRAVIRSLQQAGFIRTERGRSGGSYVIWESQDSPAVSRRLSPAMQARLLDTLTFRSVLEPGAAALAAVADLDADAQRELRARLEAARTSGADYRVADAELHACIARLSGCRALEEAIGDVQLLLNETLLQIVPLMGPALEHSHEQHDALVSAILSGDGDGARQVMDDHVRATTELIRAFLE
jgi:DNA-binding FadR family transcriptional regulator